MYDMKELYEAFSVQEAIELRLAHPEAQIIAGGSDVLVQMREGKRAGKELISIYLIDELRGVSLDENEAMCWAKRWTWWAGLRYATSVPSAATPATA